MDSLLSRAKPMDSHAAAPSLIQLERDPLWFPNAISHDLARLQFVRVTEAELVECPFLDHRHLGSTRPEAVVDLTTQDLPAAVQRLRAANRPAGFIFHSAFCRSTALASALQTTGTLVLKEPDILRQCIAWLPPVNVAGGCREDLVAELILCLVQRPLRAAERVIIKPTNLAGPWLERVRARGSHVLLVYSGLRDFLISILDRGEPGRLFARQTYAMLAARGGLSRISQDRGMLLTDIQVAALAWRQQLELFAEAAEHGGEIRTLASDDFAGAPADALQAAFRFFDIDRPAGACATIATHAFDRNAKRPAEAFDRLARERERAKTEADYSGSLEATLTWISAQRIARDLRLPLANALVPQEQGAAG